MLKALSGMFNERAVRLQFLGLGDPRRRAAVRAAPRLLAEVARTLDAAELPELYVTANPVPNALTIGMNKPFIVINSGLVDLLDEEELRFVIAHELGHALSGHAVYQTLLQRLIVLSGVLSAVPVGGAGHPRDRGRADGVVAQGRAVRRPGRAARDPGPAGGVPGAHEAGQRGHLEDLDTTSFFAQGQEYDEAGDLRDSVLKLLLVEARSHPFAVVRAAELRRWVDSGEYTRSSPARTRAATTTPTPRSARPRRRPRRATPRRSGRPRTPSVKLVHDTAGFLGSVKLWFDELRRRGEGLEDSANVERTRNATTPGS